MASILVLLGGVTLSLQLESVQNFIARQAVHYLSKELNTKIALKRIYLKPFQSLVLEGFELYDRKGDTILIADELNAAIDLSQYWNDNKVVIKKLTLDNTTANYQIYKDSSNIKFLLDYFTPSKKDEKKTSKKLILDLKQLKLVNNQFRYINHTKKHYTKVVDFGDLDIKHLNAEFDNIKFDHDSIYVKIKQFNLVEKKGLKIKGLTANAFVSNKKIELANLFLTTNRSTIKDYVKLEFNGFDDFSDFNNRVHVRLNIKNSFLHSEDIAFFSSTMHQVRFDLKIKQASAQGKVNHIYAKNINLETEKSTKVIGDVQIIGLPDIEQTDFKLTNLHVTSSYDDLQKIIPNLSNNKNFKLPQLVKTFNTLQYDGDLNGQYNNFQIQGSIKTDLGLVSTKSVLNFKNKIQYAGLYQSKSFDLGKLLENKLLKTTGFDLNLKGSGTSSQTLALDVNGKLENFFFRDYTYRQIPVKGIIKDEKFVGSGAVIDPNATIDFQTDINWSNPAIQYNLSAAIKNTNLHAIHLSARDSIIVQNTTMTTNLMGGNINNLVGDLKAENINFSTRKGNFHINDILFKAEGDENNRLLTLSSDVVDATLNGQIDLNTIIPYFKMLAMRYAPAIGFEVSSYNNQNFELHLNIKSFEPIATFFKKEISLDSGATLQAKFSSEEHNAQFNLYSPIFKYSGIKVSNLIVDQISNPESMSVFVSADRINLTDSTYIKNINISNVLANDSLRFNMKLSELNASNNLDLNGVIRFANQKPAYINFDPSTIIINKDKWAIKQEGELKVSKGKWYIQNLILNHEEQKVNLNGVLSNEESDQLNIGFKDFNLSSLNGITKPLGINLIGEMNGELEINSIFKSPYFIANLHTNPILYNQLPIGELSLKANYDQNSNLVNLDSKIEEGNKLIKLSGTYNIKEEKDKLNLEASLQNTDLILFQPFLKSLISNLNGKTNADLTIKGDIHNPKISGNANFKDAVFTINYLKTPYHLNDKVIVLSNGIFLQNFKLLDPKNNEATINGMVDLNKLSDPTIDVKIKANNFLTLNTTVKDNNLYYGTAYATGDFNFKGLTSAINIDIKAKSNDNTVINIPFNSTMTISDNDFIYFVSNDTLKTSGSIKRKNFNGITMNMDLSVSPNAEMNLFTSLGGLSGRGTGNINMNISSLGDFEMFGDYVINSGKFNFKAQDYINKIFNLKEGGTIRWAGNPSEANINLTAIYQQRTSLSALYNAAGQTDNPQRVLAQADMNLKGQLNQPEINFDLNFPQDPYVKDELQGYLSDVNNVNQQALSLIVRRSFTPGSQTDFGKEVNNTLLSAGTEIAFNQLNNIIAESLNINFFDLNIKSLNDASASLRLFNDRLILTGGITDNRNNQLNDLNVFSDRVSTDAEALFYLRKDGRLLLRGSNRLNTRNFLINPNGEEYVSAVGLVYRQEFNSFSEFLKRMFPFGKKKKAKQQ
ncbi:translocation/assembly module TamB [Sphingobacterium sp. SRCM116780]|uniref:translocation/assembly module TamB domain-containing protein n=1 Tax=Sphingobacterium sp. SRCM116780 TaxID=2907623 RepID=UPI001F2C0A4F|nr:translocation/assembly module TamB domain-containing protein [Sphingobacterium sp. SRCM116780]UIR56458.1 translocation/assembly module TamB [Sphingobacterium sp. SRCM116780]